MNVSLESFPKFSLKLFFEMLMDGWSKNSNNLFTKTPMDASEWIKKYKEIINCRKVILVPNKCIGNVLFFQKHFVREK